MGWGLATAYSTARSRLTVQTGVNGDVMECLISNLNLAVMLRALGFNTYAQAMITFR